MSIAHVFDLSKKFVPPDPFGWRFDGRFIARYSWRGHFKYKIDLPAVQSRWPGGLLAIGPAFWGVFMPDGGGNLMLAIGRNSFYTYSPGDYPDADRGNRCVYHNDTTWCINADGAVEFHHNTHCMPCGRVSIHWVYGRPVVVQGKLRRGDFLPQNLGARPLFDGGYGLAWGYWVVEGGV